MSVRTTFDDNGDADSYEIKYNTYRLLATAYNNSASAIQIWNKNILAVREFTTPNKTCFDQSNFDRIKTSNNICNLQRK